MKASQFSDAQKAFILKQGNDGMPVADICRKAGISQATYFNWKISQRSGPKNEIASKLPSRITELRITVASEASSQKEALSCNIKACLQHPCRSACQAARSRE
jgi:hypothetical protein